MRIRVVGAVVLLAGIAAAVAWWANCRTTPRQEAFGTNAESFLDGLLRFEGLQRSRVTVVDVAPAALDGVVDGPLEAAVPGAVVLLPGG